ncbi:GNAT family N-acetyltransferase [Sediminibacillus massiliensis]|uniref:GNAT family N-acetyltransferase n=1 Tax=Sediminibacillus massiliensis TaxID=1926277 RepID=UPI0009887D99|nr:GNAT family N-acetyltransferase [Sediminibacillus massiliensis]
MKIQKLNNKDTYPMDLLLTADPDPAMVAKYITNGECFAAMEENRIRGVYILVKTKPETAEIVNIAVQSQYQGKGIGKRLLRDAEYRTKAMGLKRLEIGTGNSSIGQLALYQKCGFRLDKIIHDFFLEHYSEPIFENGIACRDMIRLYKMM